MNGSRIGAGLVVGALLATASPALAQRGASSDTDDATATETSMPPASPCPMGQRAAQKMARQAGQMTGLRMGSSEQACQMGQMGQGGRASEGCQAGQGQPMGQARQMGQGQQMGQGGMMQGRMQAGPDETPLAERARLEQMQSHMVDRMRQMAKHMWAIQERLAELDAEGGTP